jgi:hypothetical protein
MSIGLRVDGARPPGYLRAIFRRRWSSPEAPPRVMMTPAQPVTGRQEFFVRGIDRDLAAARRASACGVVDSVQALLVW